MKDVVFDATTNDMVLDDNGWDFLLTADDSEYIVNKIRIKLSLWLGEWFLDTSQGIDYLNYAFQKGSDINHLNSLIRDAITEEPLIASVGNIQSTVNTLTRGLNISFTAVMVNGDNVNFDEGIL